jgi:hypothetical protein
MTGIFRVRHFRHPTFCNTTMAQRRFLAKSSFVPTVSGENTSCLNHTVRGVDGKIATHGSAQRYELDEAWRNIGGAIVHWRQERV